MTDLDPIALLFMTAGASDDPGPAYARLRDECPVARTPGLTGGMTAWISSYEEVLWALKHPEVFSSAAEAVDIGQHHDLIPLQIDPPMHTRYRRFLASWFNSRAIAPLEPEVRRRVNGILDGIVDRGQCDFHHEFSTPLPSTVFLAMMGLPESDVDMFLGWVRDIVRPAVAPDEAEALRARIGSEITAYFDAQISELRATPRAGFWSDLVNTDFEGRPLTRAELLGMAFLLIIGGLDTVTATLDCMIEYLAQHPARRRQLVRSPELIPDAIEEMLRALSPVQLIPRVIARDATVGGVDLQAGDQAIVVLGAANLDATIYDQPDTVDFERQRSINLAFGGGPHLCLGINLARLELRVALEEWHRRIPDYSIPAGTVITHSPGIRQADHLPLAWAATPRQSTQTTDR